VIRLFVRIKPYFLKTLKKIFSPLKKILMVLVIILLLIYRLLSIVRRNLSRIYRPAKNKMMAVIANRYLVHAIMAIIVLATVALNFQTTDVRAESFGERSLLYELVAGNNLEIIEEYASDTTAVELTGSSYQNQGTLSSLAYGISDIATKDASVTFIGGHLVSIPTTTETPSTAARSNVEKYTVQGGDTLSSIASNFGISINTLLWANNLTVRSVLQPGDVLAILPVDGITHTVKSGDTISSISQKYDIDQETITDYNGISTGDVLAVGDELLIPGGEKQIASASSSSAIGRIFTPPSVSSPTTTTSISTDSASSSGAMVWPTDMYVITQYYGWSHNGLDIDCGYDNDNYAADAGYVSYAGWMNGYGYLVEINHGNGIVTRYGHHASLYVAPGDYVYAGQPIGRCGTTGRSTGTHLHFELRVNGSTKNPLEYIR